MKRIFMSGLVMIFLMTGFTGPVSPAALTSASAPDASAKTYTVLVGAEKVSKGIDVENYYPSVLHIHPGDTVTWKQNTNEIHTVTFLAGGSLQDFITPSADGIVINPLAASQNPASGSSYDGATFANSGIFGADPSLVTSYSLTFTKQGTFTYVCFVHGVEMMGTIVVDPPSVREKSPADVTEWAKNAMAEDLAHANSVYAQAVKLERKPDKNPDGSHTYYVNIGFMKGNVDLMDFFPNKIEAKPGDTLVFQLSPQDMAAPHTVTFLNGNPDPPLAVFAAPNLIINPAIVNPQNPAGPLTKTGEYSSGLLAPGTPFTMFAIKVGNVHGKLVFQCLIHDASGMVGTLYVDN